DLPGFGQSLAAIAPSAAGDGIVAFQPSDGKTFEAQDVLQLRYKVVAAKIIAQGMPTPLLSMDMANKPAVMLVDPQERLWVGVASGDGSVFVVLARKP